MSGDGDLLHWGQWMRDYLAAGVAEMMVGRTRIQHDGVDVTIERMVADEVRIGDLDRLILAEIERRLNSGGDYRPQHVV